MATTPTHAIVYPVVGNTITPLATHFANLANSTDTALTTLSNGQDGYIGTDAARLATIAPRLREGVKWYSTDTDRNWFYDGAAWVSNDSGSFLLRPTSVVGATVAADGTILPTNGSANMSINGVFSARFRKYHIEYFLRYTAGNQTLIRLRAAGTDHSPANYTYTTVEWNGTAIVGSQSTTETAWHMNNSPNQSHWGEIEIGNPATTGTSMVKHYTGVFASAFGGTGGSVARRSGHLAGADASVFDGFTILSGSTFSDGTSWIKVRGLA